MAKNVFPRTISKRKIAGRSNPVGQLVNGVGALKGVFSGVADAVARAANPAKRKK